MVTEIFPLFYCLIWYLCAFSTFLDFQIDLVRTEAFRRNASLKFKATRWIRKNSYKLRRRKFSFCWGRLFSNLSLEQIMALGNFQTKSRLQRLLNNYQNFSSYNVSFGLVGVNNHIEFSKTRRDLPFTILDNSTWFANANQVVEIATNVNASNLGTSYASEIVKQQIKQAINVNTALTETQKRQVQHEVPFPLMFKSTHPVTHDHSVVAAFREIARQIYDASFKVAQLSVPTLAIGAAFREFAKYGANNYIHYYFHGEEAKDYDRSILWFLNSFVSSLAKKAGAKNRKLRRNVDSEITPVHKNLNSFRQILDDYRELNKIPDIFKTEVDYGYEVLLMEDSFYNFRRNDYKTLFEKTGANIAYGYGMLPLELNFPEIPPSPHYNINFFGGKVELTFRYSSGYVHDYDAWTTLLLNPVMNFGTFSLVTEIVSMIGPMAVFKIMKVNKEENLVRRFELPEHKKYVKILDLFNSVASGFRFTKLKYFSVAADEFLETVNYNAALDPKALTYQNCLTFIRRRSGGVSLITKQLLAPWILNSKDYQSFAMTTFLVAKIGVEKADQLINSFNSRNSAPKGIYHFLTNWEYGAIYKFLTRNNIFDKLVIYPDDHIRQKTYITLNNPKTLNYQIRLDEAYNAKAFDCPICESLDGKLGDQLLKCEHKNTIIKMKMSEFDLTRIENELIDTDMDAQKLAEVKKRAQSAMPKGGFEIDVKVHYICGGPGTGKSYIIRKLATTRDLIYAPFTKLREDYVNLTDNEGRKYDLLFKTIHRGLEVRGAHRIFVDEFTSLPYEYIKMVCYLNSATELFIVGDHKQSCVQEGEGTYIGNEIDLSSLGKHTLLRNFRNPQGTVHLLNKLFGYEMEARSLISDRNIFIHKRWENDTWIPEQNAGFLNMVYNSKDAVKDGINSKGTVRSYQGSSKPKWVLKIDKDTTETSLINNLTTVALSRHSEELHIILEDCEPARAWLQKYDFDDVEIEHVRTYENNQVIPNYTLENERVDKFIDAKFSEGDIQKPRLGWYDRISFVFDNIITSKLLYFCLIHCLFDKLFSLNTFPGNFYLESVQQIFQIVFGFYFYYHIWENFGNLGNNSDLYCLIGHHILNWVCYRVYGTDQLMILHFYNTAIYPAYVRWFHHFWVIAKLRYFARIFSIDTFSFTSQLILVTVFGWFFALTIHHYGDGFEYLCDFFSQYYIFVGIIFLRWHNFRFCNWRFTFDTVKFTQSLNNFHAFVFRIYDHETFVNYVRTDFTGSTEFFDYFMNFVSWGFQNLYKRIPSIQKFHYVPIMKFGRDSHFLATDLVPAIFQRENSDGLNEITSVFFDTNTSSGVIAVDFISPVNLKNRLTNLTQKYRQMFSGHGYTFRGKHPMQLLQVLVGRYFSKKRKAKKNFGHEAQLLAKEICQEFIKDCTNFENLNFDEIAFSQIVDEAMGAANKKKYAAMFKGFDNSQVDTVRAHLKNIYKPKTQGLEDPYKCGQGIFAWNKDPQIYFLAASRVINELFIKGLKDNIIYDNKVTPDELKDQISRLSEEILPAVATNGISDFTQFDMQQDEFTQQIEKYILQEMGISEQFIDQYYRFRANYTVQADDVRGKAKFEKTSGEPLTLLLNTILALVLTHYLIRGKGPMMLVGKGDDGFKRQCGLKVDYNRVDAIEQFTQLKIKLQITDQAEFCGYVITQRNFIESIVRKLQKVMTHKYRDYKHFTEYQTSLRDWLKEINNDALYVNLAANAEMYDTTIVEMESILACINSLSHINEQTFKEIFPVKADTPMHVDSKRKPVIQGPQIVDQVTPDELIQLNKKKGKAVIRTPEEELFYNEHHRNPVRIRLPILTTTKINEIINSPDDVIDFKSAAEFHKRRFSNKNKQISEQNRRQELENQINVNKSLANYDPLFRKQINEASNSAGFENII